MTPATLTPRIVVPAVLCVLVLSAVGCADQQPSPSGEDRPVLNRVNANANNNDDAAIDFNRDIRPILSDRCFACHGPDAAVAQDAGGFRLDLFETATAPAASGATPIVPGDAAASELIRRLTSDNPRIVMPPPSAKLSVTDTEVDLLRRWIDAGAEYQGHWAYERPVKRPLPAIVNADWARNAVDYFVAARLEAEGLSPSGEADRATLIRRLSLDLTGLPPTPGQVDAFVNDASPGAYERVVDRLLASPHFGERWALVWLDAARYADTNGFHHDNIRNAWPWRQWVIESFNANKPYDQFIIEQLAGDLLPNATQDQRLASAFCRMHNMNDEGGALDEEYRVEAIADRIETIATVMMGQTYTCARCHDHKYDPISQDDYFSLWAYFNSVEERGVYRRDFGQALAYPARMSWVPPELEPQLAEARARRDQAVERRDAQTPEIVEEQAAWEQAMRRGYGVDWPEATLASARSSDERTAARVLDDGSVLLAGDAVPDHEEITLTLHTDATGLRLIKLDALQDDAHDKRVGRASNGNAVLSHIRVQAVSLADPAQTRDIELAWAWASYEQPNGDFDIHNALRDDAAGWAVGGHLDPGPRTAVFVADQPFGFEGGTEVRITLVYRSPYAQHSLGRVKLAVGTAPGGNKLYRAFPVAMSAYQQVGPFKAADFETAYATAFGPEQADAAGRAFGDLRWQSKPDYRDAVAYTPFNEANAAYYIGRVIDTPSERELDLSLGSDDALRVFLNGQEVYANKTTRAVAADSDRVTVTLNPGTNHLVLKIVNSGGPGGFYLNPTPADPAYDPFGVVGLIPRAMRTADLRERYDQAWRDAHSPTYRALNQAVAEAEAHLAELEAQVVPVAVMKELETPTQAYVLNRGAYDGAMMDRPAHRRPPNFMALPLPEGAPNNRLGFAQWLTRPDHPLTARVHVNRLWQMLFGTGIVKTAEDFGSQADWPSHPDLLDHLAVDFVESGWDQKALIKQVVMSATYRQKAVTQSESIEVDPDNRLLSYFPRRRLPAEMIRDQALFVAGLLNDAIGGPSVRPYQPGGLWREVSIGGSSNTQIFRRDDGDALYRRSMYTFWKRTSPPPQMATFNAPTREFCVVNREVTNTPLQALVLWNDEQFLEAARVLAQRTLEEAGDDEQRIARIFQRCTGRVPDGRVLGVLRDTLDHFRSRYDEAPEDARALLTQGEYPLPEQHDPAELAAWMMIGSAVLSLDETIVRD